MSNPIRTLGSTEVEWHSTAKHPDYNACACLVSIGDIVYPAAWKGISKCFVDVGGAPFEEAIQAWAFMPLSPYSKFTKDELLNDLMTTCQHCQHWLADPTQVKLVGHGICVRASTVERGGTRADDQESLALALAEVTPASGYEMVISQLETTANFGCNQFKATE